MCRFFLRLLQYEVLRAAEDYEHEKLAQESKAAREKKELVAEKNREKRELTRMRKEETRTRAVLKKEGEKVAKKQRKVESQEAKVARKKAKAQKAKMCIPCLRRFRPVGRVLCTSRMTGAWDVGDVVRSRWIGGGGLGSLTQQEDDFKYSVPSMHFSHLHVCPIWLKEEEHLLAVCFRLGACKFNFDRMLYT